MPSYAYAPPPSLSTQPPYGPGVSSRSVARPPVAAPTKERSVSDQEKRANQLSAELTRVRRERDQAQAELAMWTGLGVTLDQVKDFQNLLARLQDENKFLVRQNSELDVKLSRFIGPEKEPRMPTGVSGKILTVDPKYEFVVLNVGGDQGVARNGKLLVNRNGKLVAKVRITSVQSNSSIANILPDWKLAEVMEGDQVIHQ